MLYFAYGKSNTSIGKREKCTVYGNVSIKLSGENVPLQKIFPVIGRWCPWSFFKNYCEI